MSNKYRPPQNPESFRHKCHYTVVKEWDKWCRERPVARGKWNVKKRRK